MQAFEQKSDDHGGRNSNQVKGEDDLAAASARMSNSPARSTLAFTENSNVNGQPQVNGDESLPPSPYKLATPNLIMASVFPASAALKQCRVMSEHFQARHLYRAQLIKPLCMLARPAVTKVASGLCALAERQCP